MQLTPFPFRTMSVFEIVGSEPAKQAIPEVRLRTSVLPSMEGEAPSSHRMPTYALSITILPTNAGEAPALHITPTWLLKIRLSRSAPAWAVCAQRIPANFASEISHWVTVTGPLFLASTPMLINRRVA